MNHNVQLPQPRDVVRLVVSASGMAAGSEGVLIGWFAREEREALVSFWDGGPLRVPAQAIKKA
jgi:hypothetical protein